jgi:hypothetical protein
MDEEIGDALKRLSAAFGQAQAFNLALSYILAEIMCDLARSRPDPQRYIADMFERVSARADQMPIESEVDLVTSEFRYNISRFFSQVGQRLGRED